MYQTVFATEPGSAEMPSAGRPFTPELVTRLISQGVQIAPLLLHTGVASLENHEPPYEEFYRVPARHGRTCQRRQTRRSSQSSPWARPWCAPSRPSPTTRGTFPGEGWTSLVITPDRPVRAVSGLITGLHDPQATHLTLLKQVAAMVTTHGRDGDEPIGAEVCGSCHLERAYAEARQRGYRWHEFGDSHLILGRSATVNRPS